MSSERLRQAADRLDWHHDDQQDCGCDDYMDGASHTDPLCRERRAAAALLRAAADLPGWWSPFDVAYPSDAVRAAALALADTILGVEE